MSYSDRLSRTCFSTTCWAQWPYPYPSPNPRDKERDWEKEGVFFLNPTPSWRQKLRLRTIWIISEFLSFSICSSIILPSIFDFSSRDANWRRCHQDHYQWRTANLDCMPYISFSPRQLFWWAYEKKGKARRFPAFIFELSDENRAPSPASWFSRNGQLNARPAVNLNVWPPAKIDISWEWVKVFWSGFLHFLQDNLLFDKMQKCHFW